MSPWSIHAKNKVKQLVVGISAGVALAVSASSYAALVSIDDAKYGAGALTWDTGTNLEWLDVTESQGRSYNYVASQLGNGGEFEGFSIASSTQFMQLIQNGGWTESFNTIYLNDPAKYNLALNLINLLGDTLPPFEGIHGAYGFVQDTHPDGHHFFDGLYIDNTSPALPFYTIAFANESGGHPPGAGDEHIGFWLYREHPVPVPEPATFALLGLGLLGIRYGRRSKA